MFLGEKGNSACLLGFRFLQEDLSFAEVLSLNKASSTFRLVQLVLEPGIDC